MILEEKPGSRTELDDKNPSAAEKIKSALSAYLYLGDNPEKVGPAEFVDRLDTVVEHVKNLQALKNLYKLNQKIESEATNDLKELEFLVKEMKALMTNICRLRRNKIDILKETDFMKGSIEKKSKEEVQEMETVIAIYDKDLLKKWHVAKKTSAPASLENFIANLAGKKQAIEHVYKLALDRLATLKKAKTEPPPPPTFHLRFTGLNAPASLNGLNSTATLNGLNATATLNNNNDTDSDTDTDEQFSLC